MTGALEGIKVLDCSQIIAGPMAASLLSEMGADVVKVEPPEGEPWRLQAEIMPKESRTFLAQNRGKRGVAIDFKNPAARQAREALIRWADVLVTNYRPGVATRLGLDYETARALNPALIYCENTALGHAGPDAMRRGYDIIAQAMSGLLTANPVFQNGVPRVAPFAPADMLTGAVMAWAITAALFHRERTGEGQRIHASLLMSALYIQAGFKEIARLDDEPRERKLADLEQARARGATLEEIDVQRRAGTPETLGNVYYRTYQTADGYLVVGALGPAPRARFREALGVRDPRYEQGFVATPENIAEAGIALTQECEHLLRGQTTAAWLAVFDAHEIAAGPVRYIEELWNDPGVRANGYVAEYSHPLLGELRGPAPVVRMDGTPTRVQRASPALGEHTESLLGELGLSQEDLAALRRSGAIL